MEKILIIEDDDSIRKLLRYDLKHANYDVDTAEDGLNALEKARSSHYDAIICDWMIPHKSGIEVVCTLRSEGYQGVIIMLTAKDEEEDILEAFEAGVDDYLTKPFSPRVLTARISAHLKRSSLSLKHHDQVIGNTIINTELRSVIVEGQEIDLTKKEFDLLHYLVENQNSVKDRDQILTEIWDFGYDGDTRIVDVHIHKLRAKLEQSTIHIESLRGIGYVIKTK
ncbi:two-component system response regulator [Erysipelothrix larvae]|uniref:Two-component system response regulator n=1 Tax=Erysipelothrix larvae TaxID=1514105 RepID=A0A0X8GZN5_9FIRM|nr:response regulator transcription factor [Erysipelothrix larvae]AMC93371.1 two-component system response regulator [Erysipelothrix larvae]